MHVVVDERQLLDRFLEPERAPVPLTHPVVTVSSERPSSAVSFSPARRATPGRTRTNRTDSAIQIPHTIGRKKNALIEPSSPCIAG